MASKKVEKARKISKPVKKVSKENIEIEGEQVKFLREIVVMIAGQGAFFIKK